jgi:hypothetical protein
VAAETRFKHRRQAAGAGARLTLGNSGFRNKKLSFKRIITENFQYITKFSEKL